MTSVTNVYEDALFQISSAYSSEFSDYSGTMSYLSGIWEDEVNDLIGGGLS